jgi:hypothetical protein
MGKRAILCLAVMALILSACGSTKTDATAASDAPSADATPITAADPYAIPTTIDAAYINKVMKALEQVRGNVRRDVVGHQTMTQVDYEELDDIYDGDLLAAQRHTFSDSSDQPQPDIKRNPGDEVYTVTKIRAATPSCIAFEDVDDTSAVYANPMPPSGTWVEVLWPVKATHGYNPTPWKIELEEPVSSEANPYEC